MAAKRCKCHPSAYYLTCGPCPRCRHWSFDPWARSCERRRCGYEEPEPEPEQLALAGFQ